MVFGCSPSACVSATRSCSSLGSGLPVTMWVMEMEKNFSSRCWRGAVSKGIQQNSGREHGDEATHSTQAADLLRELGS